MADVPLTDNQLRGHIVDGLRRLRSLVELYDGGEPYFAPVMAAEVHRIVAGTQRGRNAGDGRVNMALREGRAFPSPHPATNGNLAAQHVLIGMQIMMEDGRNTASFYPIGDQEQRYPVSFETWWGAWIYMADNFSEESQAAGVRKTASREELVRMLRDKLGAHLDETQPEILVELQRAGSFGDVSVIQEQEDGSELVLRAEDGIELTVGPAAASMRAIAGEVLEAYADLLDEGR